MTSFVKNHPLFCMIVALALLLATVIGLVALAYTTLDGFVFFLTWLSIGGIGAFLLLRIIDSYEKIEIQKYKEYRDKSNKEHQKNDNGKNH